MDPRANDATALADCLERKRDQGSHRRKDNRDVEKVGQQSVRTAFPLCLQAQSEGLTGAISQPCERVDGTPLRFDNMRQNMGRGAEAEETDSLALAGDDQRTPADQAVQSSGADETSLPASPSGNAKRASATVAVAKPPTRLKPVLRHLAALLQRVLTVHQHFGLDDGDQPGFLAQCGVPGQSLRTGLDASSTSESRRPARSPPATWQSARTFGRSPRGVQPGRWTVAFDDGRRVDGNRAGGGLDRREDRRGGGNHSHDRTFRRPTLENDAMDARRLSSQALGRRPERRLDRARDGLRRAHCSSTV